MQNEKLSFTRSKKKKNWTEDLEGDILMGDKNIKGRRQKNILGPKVIKFSYRIQANKLGFKVQRIYGPQILSLKCSCDA